MDFFAHQEQAKRRSVWLILGFLIAVLILVTAVDAVAVGVATLAQGGELPSVEGATPVVIVATVFVLLLVGIGSAAKTASLSAGGGEAIALRLGGRRVQPGGTQGADRQLMNVVEEMALASGVPTPAVYVLDGQREINAFAAGLKPGNAVVAVTQGALEQLDRDELQGVVAHEFSHILNGDMRLNLKLMGLIHGILVMALAGRVILYALRHVRVRGKAGAVVALAALVGVALFILGYVGYAAGSILRAAVNRQREYLADAAAVQFTRNPSGLSGALQKLRAGGSRVRAATTSEVSHLFFGNALRRPFLGFLATHPPLADRLDRIDPTWRDERAPDAPAIERPAMPPPLRAEQVSGLIGRLDVSSPTRGAAALAALPAVVHEAADDAFTARAVVLAAIADPRPEIAKPAIRALADIAGAQLASETLGLHAAVAALPPGGALSVVLLAIPTLREMSERHRITFLRALESFVRSDAVVTLHEHALAELVALHLGARPPMAPPPSKSELRAASDELLAVLGRTDTPTDEDTRRFHAALQTCRAASPPQKRKLVDAAAAVVSQDGVVSATEEEVLRLVVDSLECPMPRLA